MSMKLLIGLVVLAVVVAGHSGHDHHDHDHREHHDHDHHDHDHEHGDHPDEPRVPVTIGVLHKPTSCNPVTHEDDKVLVKLQLYKMVLDRETSKAAKVLILDKEKVLQVGSYRFIEGVEQGVLGACVGEKRSLRIPSSIGFGELGSKKLAVDPHTDLRAVVEILAIEASQQQDPMADDDDDSLDEDMDPLPDDAEGGEEDDEPSPLNDDAAAEMFDEQVPSLTTSDELNELRSRKNVLVMFYAPWCGHCTQLKPKYAQVAYAFHTESDVAIVAVDATVAEGLAAEFEIEGYPTLYAIPHGKEPQVFEAPRTTSAMVRVVNQLFHTERQVDGRLTEHAGTDADLNFEVDNWIQGKRTLEQLLAFLPEGSYYKRVAEMVHGHGPEKVLSERKRLEKLLEAGNMKSSQLDATQRRLNVLNVFHVEALKS